MNSQKACDWLLENEAQEYTDRTKPQHARCFGWRRFQDAPNCAQNGKSPRLHVIVYAPHRPYPDLTLPGCVEFEVMGKVESGELLAAKVYGVDLENMVAALPKAERAATAIWTAFVASMKP